MPRAEKSLRRLAVQDRERVLTALAELSRTDPPRGDLKKLQARPDEWRLRVGDVRAGLTFNRASSEIAVL